MERMVNRMATKKLEQRPIDADELKRVLLKKNLGLEVLGAVFEVIDSAPTVDLNVSQGRVTGKWETIMPDDKNKCPKFRCSTCGFLNKQHKTDFCSHCGSDNRATHMVNNGRGYRWMI